VRSQHEISANRYFNPSFSVLWYHALPSDASEPNTTKAWVVGALTLVHSPDAQDSLGAPVQMDRTLTGRMQHWLAGLLSPHKHPKAQDSCPRSLVLPWGMDHLKS
jgi:hypothetical protein